MSSNAALILFSSSGSIVTCLCDLVIRTPTVLPSLALDSGTPCRNDQVKAGRFHHLNFSRYPDGYYLSELDAGAAGAGAVTAG